MKELFIKSEYEDGTVYFKLKPIADPTDEYIYEGLEVMLEEGNHWEIDEYELTEEDLEEMYDDGFCNIEAKEFEQAYQTAKKEIQP